jgi:hypothetical protein
MDLYELKNLIAKWFFMSSITQHYTGSPETKMEIDLAKLRGVEKVAEFKQILEDIIEALLIDDFWDIRLPLDLATSYSTSSSLYGFYAAQYVLGV